MEIHSELTYYVTVSKLPKNVYQMNHQCVGVLMGSDRCKVKLNATVGATQQNPQDN